MIGDRPDPAPATDDGGDDGPTGIAGDDPVPRSVTTTLDVVGPWSLATSRRFWEGFAPQRLRAARSDSTPEVPARRDPAPDGLDSPATEDSLTTTFLAERTWQSLQAEVTQEGRLARIALHSGDGSPVADPHGAARQVARFLSLDVDAAAWPEIGERDPVIGDLQRRMPGLRPCGFHSPYEAAAWAVLSQRIRITQAAALRDRLIRELGSDRAFPSPQALLEAELDLPGRKAEYLRAVARAALDGVLDGEALRAMAPAAAIDAVGQILGIGPFSAELVVLRGANAPDALPTHEARLAREIAERYGPEASLAEISEAWRPLRTWAAVHLRAGREERTGEISGGSSGR